MQHMQGSSNGAQDSTKINRRREELRQSKDELRQSKEEMHIFQSVILQFLAPEA